MRDTAALGYDELAARAHYPSNVLKEAENGPSLPGLPILAAYVRACDGDVPQWEERWRCLGYETRADPGLPVRPAGTSPAAAAGARAGISIAPPDMYDPDRIRAALRGQRVLAEQSMQSSTAQSTVRPEATAAVPGRTDPDTESAGATAATGPGWGGIANRGADADTGTAAGWDTDTSRSPGPAWNAGTNRDAGSAWGAAAPANGNHHAGPQGAGPFDATEVPGHAGGPTGIRHDPFSAAWLQDSQPTAAVPDASPGREEDRPAPAERTDFWAPSAGPGAAPPSVDKEPSLSQGAGPAVPAQPQSTVKPAVQETTADVPNERRRDRLYPLRLLAVIVVAALIGSILVLLIR